MHNYTKYFKEQPGYDRLIQKIYQKYKSLSKFSGTIKLDYLTPDEAQTLSRFFGNTYKQGEDITISIKKFIIIMNNSKYTDFDISILVQEYLDVKLSTNIEDQSLSTLEEEKYYLDIISNKKGIGELWLKDTVLLKEGAYKLIHQRYKKNKHSLKKELINIITLLNNLPKEKTLLPIYSSTYTKDPHYLDLDNSHSVLFFHALIYIDKSTYPNTREEKIKLLSTYNIEIDNLSNFAITYNLLSNKEYLNQFSKNKESLILNIQNILTTTQFDTPNKQVFIFENPSILTEIIARKIDVPVIISGGFPNTSVHLLIEKLIESGNKLYYNGDFDPEGLLIANNLKARYQDNLNLFCYQKQDYDTCISKKKISDSRLKKLSKVEYSELKEIKELLLNNKYSAYQENNKDRIIDFINLSREGLENNKSYSKKYY